MSASSAPTIINAVFLVLLASACEIQQSDAIYRTPEMAAKWVSLLDSLHAPADSVLHTVILLAPPTHCQSCIDELAIWMRDYWKYPIRLVWISPTTDENELIRFLQTHSFIFPVRSWLNGNPSELGMLPFSPAKVLMSPDRQILRINVLGRDPDFEAFLNAATTY